MASTFQPPPTYALPVVVDEITGKSIFNPIWLRWFLDLSKGLSSGGAGSGTVSSVGLSVPGQFAVAGSPVVASGTITIIWNTQAANRVLAGPATGADATPTFRALVAADVPALSYVPLAAPVTKTADFTLAATENWVINNKASACVVTLPAASGFTGRVVTFQNYQAFTLTSASSDVVPQGGGAASTAILLGVAGNWATLVSDGTNWVIMQAAPFNVLLLE